MQNPKIHTFHNGASICYFTNESLKSVLFYRDAQDSKWLSLETRAINEFVGMIFPLFELKTPSMCLQKKLASDDNSSKLMKHFVEKKVLNHKIEVAKLLMEGGSDTYGTPKEWGVNLNANSTYHALAYFAFEYEEKKRPVPRKAGLGLNKPKFYLAVETCKDYPYTIHVFMAHDRATLDRIILNRFGIKKCFITSKPSSSWLDIVVYERESCDRIVKSD